MSLASFHLENGGYLAISNNAAYNFGTGDFTVEAWVKTLSGGTIVGRKSTDGGPDNGGFLLVAKPDGSIKFATDDGYGFFELNSEAASVCDGVWHHVAAVRQSAAIRIYLDGKPLGGSPRGNKPPPLNVNNGYHITLGTVDQQQEPYRSLAGNIAEVRLWNCARSDQQIAVYRCYRLGLGEAGLVGYWSAEFGLMVDFSPARNLAQIAGSVTASTNTPPVLPLDPLPTLFLFAGAYATAVKWGGTVGKWQPSGTLYITSMGFVVQGNQLVTGAQILGNTISWAGADNPSAGSITFRLSSSDPYFWPEGPQSAYDFQGSTQSGSGGAVDYRGVLLPQQVGSGMVLNIQSGQVLWNPNATVGAQVALAPKTAVVDEQYSVYDDNQIIHNQSGLAISARSDMSPGSPILFAAHNDSESVQKWTLGSDGLIRLKQQSELAISASGSGSAAHLVLAAANPADPLQQFVTLDSTQFVWSAIEPNVLAGVASASGTVDQVGACAKANDSPAQLWYVVGQSLLCGLNAQALAVTDAPAPGGALKLARFAPGDTRQRFAFVQQRLVHVPSGLQVKVAASGGAVVLGATTDSGDAVLWTISSNLAPDCLPKQRAPRVAAAGNVSYVVNVATGNFIAAGTDDKVEIALDGEWHCTGYIELKNSETHSDPFERGNIDRFTLTLPNIGKIKGLYVRYGANVWFYRDRWVVDWISVYDPTTLTSYGSGSLGGGMQYEMPASTYVTMAYAHKGGYDSTISVGKAPAQDQYTRGYMDHTWAVIKDSTQTTYFDAAGGHGGPGAVDNVVVSNISLDTAVKMATGFPIDSSHPYQPIYGHNDVSGKETCGIRASGFRNWDGQCHQIINRLLYVCTPMASLDNAAESQRPTGYGLTVLVFGKFGTGFQRWCLDHGFLPPGNESSLLFNFVQSWVQDQTQAIKVAYHAIEMQGGTATDPQYPTGPSIREFFRDVQREGISNSTVSALTCLPEDRVIEEQKP